MGIRGRYRPEIFSLVTAATPRAAARQEVSFHFERSKILLLGVPAAEGNMRRLLDRVASSVSTGNDFTSDERLWDRPWRSNPCAKSLINEICVGEVLEYV